MKKMFARMAALGLCLSVLAGCRADERAPEPPPLAGRVRLVKAQAGDVAVTVRRELGQAQAEGQDVLVYVGAAWCEPCQRFHSAVLGGQLDTSFPRLRLIEFDLDRDRDELSKAGYASTMIPLFAVPRADGTNSGKQIQGSIKGPGAVAEIAPKLLALLGRSPRGVSP